MDNWAYLIARYFINLTIIIGVAITQIDSVDIPLIILTSSLLSIHNLDIFN